MGLRSNGPPLCSIPRHLEESAVVSDLQLPLNFEVQGSEQSGIRLIASNQMHRRENQRSAF